MDVAATPGTGALHTRVEQISSEVRALGSTLEETLRDVEMTLRAQLEDHPYGTIAAAVGVGYVLGGGLPSRVTSLLLAIGGRIVMEAAVRQTAEHILNAARA